MLIFRHYIIYFLIFLKNNIISTTINTITSIEPINVNITIKSSLSTLLKLTLINSSDKLIKIRALLIAINNTEFDFIYN